MNDSHITCITIDRLQVDVRGVDPTTVHAALDALPASLAIELASLAAEPRAAVPLTPLTPRPGSDDVARSIARQIAAAVRRQQGGAA